MIPCDWIGIVTIRSDTRCITSTIETISCNPGSTASRTTTTGHSATAAMATATEPARRPTNPPWPRLPSTSISARVDSSVRTSDA